MDHTKRTELSCVQSLLRCGELCYTAFTTREWLKNGKSLPVILSLVNKDCNKVDETAIFTLINHNGRWEIRDVIPITSDITFSFVNPASSGSGAQAGSIASKVQGLYVEFKVPLSEYEQKYIAGGITAMGGTTDTMYNEYVYELSNPQSTKTFRAGITNAFSIAQAAKMTVNGKSHAWTKTYTSERDAKTISMAGSQLRDGAEEKAYGTTELNMAWIAKMLSAREAEFSTRQGMMLFCGTWNVNGQEPPQTLEPWLLQSSQGSKPDIYCIGFQELDLSPSSVVFRNASQAPPWQLVIQTALRTVGDYVLLQKKQLVGILLFVYVKREHLSKITDVAIDEVAVGIMNVMGNKGGVAVRFNICDSSFCIVNSHLNAHLANLARRNQDYHEIVRRLFINGGERGGNHSNLTADSFAFGEETDSTTVSTDNVPFPVPSILEHDFLFWMGDLNYRIEGPGAEVRSRAEKGDFLPLLAQDQLKAQIRNGAAFPNFREAPIRFAPTYKYDKDSNRYDTSSKARTPAWCDRVLWSAKVPDSVTNISYGRHELLPSDHRPVSAVFMINVKTIITEKRAQVYQELVKQLDTMENETKPDLQISERVLDFGDVRYRRSVSRTVNLANPGMVLARWLFIAKPDQKTVHKPWLIVSPHSGILMPGETTDITITVMIDREAATELNCGKDNFDDTLILHVDKGNDMFIAPTGRYLRTCFSMPLEYLVRYPGPVRSSEPIPEDSPPETRLAIPKELWRIVDYIYRFGMEEPNIFNQNGSADMMEIRECLDTGESFSTHAFNIHSMAEVLVSFLASLSDSVIPTALFHHALEASSSFNTCRQLVSTQLTAAHYNTFYYITSFLRELLTFSSSNKLTVDRLATLFSSVLLRPPSNAPPKNPEVTARKAADFIRHFLSDEK